MKRIFFLTIFFNASLFLFSQDNKLDNSDSKKEEKTSSEKAEVKDNSSEKKESEKNDNSDKQIKKTEKDINDNPNSDKNLDELEKKVNEDLSNLLNIDEEFKLLKTVNINGKNYIYVTKKKKELKLKNNEGLLENGLRLEANSVDPEIAFPEVFPVDSLKALESTARGDKQDERPAQTDTSKFIVESKHYIVYSSSSENQAKNYSDKLENLFLLYNSYFRFDEESLDNKMKVYLFDSKNEYQNYLNGISIDKSLSIKNFAYIHYPSIQSSFLAGYDNEKDSSFNYQSALQFIRSFIKNPPLWFRIGFAIYFQNIDYNKDNSLIFQDNLRTLSYIKENFDDIGRIGIKNILNFRKEDLNKDNIKNFYAGSWELISFMINTMDIYKRGIWDAIRSLKKFDTVTENIKNIQKNVFDWVDLKSLVNNMNYYITDDFESYDKTISKGIKDYKSKNYDDATRDFKVALEFVKSKNDYKPNYYLGLISYELKKHSKAQDFLNKALDETKKNKDISNMQNVYYIMGLNAYESGSMDLAKGYLEKVSSLKDENDNKNLKKLKQKLTFLS